MTPKLEEKGMRRLYQSVMMLSQLLLALSLPATALADDEPASVSLRLGGSVGGGYTSNVFGNASQVGDGLGLGRITMDADWTPREWGILKLAYRGELELNRETESERQAGNLADVTFGLRPADMAYLWVRAGGENAFYPSGARYAFTGLFGAAGLRLEVGEATTVKASYRLRRDTFPKYDLDNTSHTAQLLLELAIGDQVELAIPLELCATFYSERYLLDASGNPTGDLRSGRAWRLEPSVRILPTYDVRITGSVRGEWNDSNDTYYFSGPFGVPDATVPAELINSFESYYAAASRWEVRWQISDAVSTAISAAVGARSYTSRPAFDASGQATGDKQRDVWLRPAAELEWRFTSASLTAAYSYLHQTSNDALWDFDAHRVELLLGFWFES